MTNESSSHRSRCYWRGLPFPLMEKGFEPGHQDQFLYQLSAGKEIRYSLAGQLQLMVRKQENQYERGICLRFRQLIQYLLWLALNERFASPKATYFSCPMRCVFHQRFLQ